MRQSVSIFIYSKTNLEANIKQKLDAAHDGYVVLYAPVFFKAYKINPSAFLPMNM